METKLLSLIPKELHEDLFKEVQEVLDERQQEEEKEEKRKSKTEVSPAMKEYLASKQKKN